MMDLPAFLMPRGGFLMAVRIVPCEDVFLECDDCDWVEGPYKLQSEAERASLEHEESHFGFFPEGEDA